MKPLCKSRRKSDMDIQKLVQAGKNIVVELDDEVEGPAVGVMLAWGSLPEVT